MGGQAVRHRRWPANVLLMVVALLAIGPRRASAQRSRTGQPTSLSPVAARIPKVARAPRLSDFLNGTPREAELRITDFRQNEPGDGTPASRATTAYLSYDRTNLYVVFVCREEPGKVRAHLAPREDIGEDDQVSLYLDTFHDKQRAYVFSTNPLGIQQDGTITEGEKPDYSFDTVWLSEGRVTADGFVVWMAIPFKSVRFSSASIQSWGLALGRTVYGASETSYWPYITQRTAGFVQQLATLEGLAGVSPSHNVQLIPYASFTGARFLDASVPRLSATEQGRAGFDAKAVLHDAITLDAAVNPDFGEVESNEPQVTVNQRFEVFFPEKRPFFIENASFFTTPIDLFFSRRIVDPAVGGRVTGKVGRWVIGALGARDRAPSVLTPLDSGARYSADAGVVRIQREFGEQSNVGLLATSRAVGPATNRVVSLDSRVKLTANWVVSGQAVTSHTRERTGASLGGSGFRAEVARDGRALSYVGTYTDLGPDLRSELGFIRRVDIRQIDQYIAYRVRPEGGEGGGGGHVLSFGPALSASYGWDGGGRTQGWSTGADFSLLLDPRTQAKLSRTVGLEVFRDHDFATHGTSVSLYTGALSWLGLGASYAEGSGINYSPPRGVEPFLGSERVASISASLRPQPQLRFDQTYLYSRLAPPAGYRLSSGGPPIADNVFSNHLLRSKVNFQATRALSVRAIVDYGALLANRALLRDEGYRQLTGDVLVTYLLSPGTAVYAGYDDRYEDLVIDPRAPGGLRRTMSPTMSTGRQVFAKVSYLLRF